MLQIEVPLSNEGWDEEKEEFVEAKIQILQLEHSLVSLSKWESKWCKPFFSKTPKTSEEILDYVKFMTLNKHIDPSTYDRLTDENVENIKKYIDAPMTATTVVEDSNGKKSREIITAEVIYYWMIALQIPFECQKWHLNRLITLIKVCSVKNNPGKKRNKRDTASRYAAMNAARKKQMNTRG